MVDPEHALRRALSWLPSSIVSPNPNPAPRQFRSTDHLAPEAVAAYVDNELKMTAYLRASDHLAQCAECAREVEAQTQARSALRDSGEIRIPGHLLGNLCRISRTDPSPLTPPAPFPSNEPGSSAGDPRSRRNRLRRR